MNGTSDSFYDPSKSTGSPLKVMVGSVIDDRTYPPVPAERSYLLNRQSSSSLSAPEVDRSLALKNRVGVLEDTASYQARRNDISQYMLDNLNDDMAIVEERVMEAMAAETRRIAMEMAEMKLQYDHQFDLQNSENLRTQQHISTLKYENNQLKRKLDLTVRKLNRLQAEFDGGEAPDDELSLTGLNGMSMMENRAASV